MACDFNTCGCHTIDGRLIDVENDANFYPMETCAIEGLRDLIRKQNFELARLKEKHSEARRLLDHVKISSGFNVWTSLTKRNLFAAYKLLEEE